jgi:hypothetical protein
MLYKKQEKSDHCVVIRLRDEALHNMRELPIDKEIVDFGEQNVK